MGVWRNISAFFNVCFCTACFRGTRQEANRRMPRHGRRQTYFETPGPHRDATPCFLSKNSPYACQRTREQTQAYLGADATESGSRDERVWEQMRPRLPPYSLTGIGSRRKDRGAQKADCNTERMASALESRALKIQRKSSLAVAPSQRKFALRQHKHLLRRQHCSSLCSQSEGHEHVANMALLDFQPVLGRVFKIQKNLCAFLPNNKRRSMRT